MPSDRSIFQRRGILYPARLPAFTRVPAPARVQVWVRWFWIPEWDLDPGRTSRQQVIAYPACNLVVQHDQTLLTGPTTRVSHRDLSGRGWAVGALLRPAAAPALTAPHGPAALADEAIALDADDLTGPVHEAMAHPDRTARHTRAVDAISDWLCATLPEPSDAARLANDLVEVIDTDPTLTTLAQVSEALSTPPRTLQRVAHDWVGIPIAAMLRRRRLQEAAERLRDDASADLASIAAELGYSDQAHLTNEMRTVVGITPGAYRRDHERSVSSQASSEPPSSLSP